MRKLLLLILLTVSLTNINAQWKADTRLTNELNESASPYVCAAGKLVHVAWFDNRDGNNEIYYKRSTDIGTTWSNDTRLTNDAGLSYYPCMALSGNTIHLVWQERRDGNDEIYYKRSSDGGLTWGTDTRMTNDAAASSTPFIAANGLVVHVVWSEMRDGNNEIYYKRSADGGLTWGSDTRLTNDAAISVNASVAVSGNTVHVLWTDARDANNEIYYKKSTDGGLTWGSDTRITANGSSSDYSLIKSNGNAVHIVWVDYRDSNFEIYYKTSTDGGNTWGSDTRLTNEASASASMYPGLAITGNTVHVFWQENRDGNFEIYFKRSLNAGTTWGADTRLTNNAGISRKPMAAASSTGVHVVWYDDRDGNNEIYYTRDTSYVAAGIVSSDNSKHADIYPNPSSGKINVYVPNQNETATATIRICSITGEVLMTQHAENSNTMIDVSGLAPGVYLVQVSDAGEIIQHQKIILTN